MKTLEQVLSDLPNKLNGFDLIGKSELNLFADKESFIRHFDAITKGSLDEILISYDNHTHRYSMRVKARGREMEISLEYMQMIYDYNGPYSAMTIEEMTVDWDLESAKELLLSWVGKRK